MTYTQILRDAEAVSLVGGKAASLGAMLRAGLPVPDGFVVVAGAEHESFEVVSGEILTAFDQLGAELVAVRSSAVAEDSSDASWAGQMETYLNVAKRDVLERVQHCWQSAHSARATAYAQQHGSGQGQVAVVVQQMIQSEVSGVAFSVHPVTQDATQLIIEAGLGLGEAIVSGEITPDTYVVDKSTLSVLDRDISEQEKFLSQAGWQPAGPDGETQKLDDAHITALAKIIVDLEQFWNFPVDVEWALYGGKLYITQSRPITTL